MPVRRLGGPKIPAPNPYLYRRDHPPVANLYWLACRHDPRVRAAPPSPRADMAFISGRDAQAAGDLDARSLGSAGWACARDVGMTEVVSSGYDECYDRPAGRR